MAIRIAIVAECETLKFVPTRKMRAELVRYRDTENGDLTYIVRLIQEGRESEVMTPDYVRAKRQYEFWRDMTRSF